MIQLSQEAGGRPTYRCSPLVPRPTDTDIYDLAPTLALPRQGLIARHFLVTPGCLSEPEHSEGEESEILRSLRSLRKTRSILVSSPP